jgi:hypothetical protein
MTYGFTFYRNNVCLNVKRYFLLNDRFFDFDTARKFFRLLLPVLRSLWSTSFPSPFLTLPAFVIILLAAFL